MEEDNGVQFYSHHARELKHTQQHKIDQFLSYNKIQYSPEDKCFYCLPLTEINYNKRTYTLKHDKELGFTCNCQGYQSKLRRYRQDPKAGLPGCSHVGALYEHFSRTFRTRREENVYAGIQLVLPEVSV
jgi:hypothetical protein